MASSKGTNEWIPWGAVREGKERLIHALEVPVDPS